MIQRLLFYSWLCRVHTYSDPSIHKIEKTLHPNVYFMNTAPIKNRNPENCMLTHTHNTCTCLWQQTPSNSPPERQDPEPPHLGTVGCLQQKESIATCIAFVVNTLQQPHLTTVLHNIYVYIYIYKSKNYENKIDVKENFVGKCLVSQLNSKLHSYTRVVLRN